MRYPLRLLAALGFLERTDQPGGPERNGSDPYAAARERMVREQLGADRDQPIRHLAVLEAMGRVPRHEFVSADLRAEAYADWPLPIGCGQTISQPYIVALMTELIDPKPTDRVLEIGTGSGYQAAVLAELVDEVYTIEIIDSLAQPAAVRLDRLGYHNVHVRSGDGHLGWPEAAPFDVITVTCAPEAIPAALGAQLKDGGRMVIPVGPLGNQELYMLRKEHGRLRQHDVLGVRFVPMTGGGATM